MKRIRKHTRIGQEAVKFLGAQIKLERKRRKWTERNLAERAGISLVTLRKIENGEMSCAVGLVFDVAVLAGVELFGSDNTQVSRSIQHVHDKLALLPQRIRPKQKLIFDDF